MEKISDYYIQKGVYALAGRYIPLTLHHSGPDEPHPERVSFSDGAFRFSLGPEARPSSTRRRISPWALALLGVPPVLLLMGANLWVVAFAAISLLAYVSIPAPPESATVVTPEFAPGLLLVGQGSKARIHPGQLLAGAAAADPLAAWEAASILAKGDATTYEARKEAALLLFRLYNRHVDDEANKAVLEGASDLGRLSLYRDRPL